MSEEINNSENIGPIEEPEPEQQQIETGKKKKQLSEHQIEHLNKIRVKALERKREIKLQKHKQYEEECRKKRQENIKQVPLNQPVESIKEPIKEHAGRDNVTATQSVGIVGGAVPVKEPVKEHAGGIVGGAVPVKEEPKKKKTVKKIIKYVEESDDDEAEEIEEVIVKKNNKPKPQQVKQTENQYADLLYNSSLDRLRERMLNERAKTLVSNVIPCYF